MKIVFSRKGFDSSAGGGPSPIVDGVPVTLPIPAYGTMSNRSYRDLGLHEHAAVASRGRVCADDLCHHDPMFLPGGQAMLGQVGAAQSHLEGQGVGPGAVFLFFGLFREGSARPHHRIFGCMTVHRLRPMADLDRQEVDRLRALGMPHAFGAHGPNDTLWQGPGRRARAASPALRLTVAEGPPSLWTVPPWLGQVGLTYHRKAERWLPDNRLQSAPLGQEFVADIGDRANAHAWLAEILSAI